MRHKRVLLSIIIGWLSLAACTSPVPAVTPTLSVTPASSVMLPTIIPRPQPVFAALADEAWQVWRVSSAPNAIFALVTQGDQLWVGTRYGVWQFDLKVKRPVRHDQQLGSTQLLLPLENGQLWANTSKGLFFFDGQEWRRIQLTGKAPPSGNGGFTALGLDRDGNLWLEFSNYRGIQYNLRYRGHIPSADTMTFDAVEYYGLPMNPGDCDQWRAVARTYAQAFYSADECRALQRSIETTPYNSGRRVLDADGSFWLAQLSYNIVSHWSNGAATAIALPDDTRIYAVASDPTRGIWIGTDRGLAHVAGTEVQWQPDLEQIFPDLPPVDLAIEPSGTVWIQTVEFKLEWLPGSDAQAHFQPIANLMARSMAAAPDGLWITHGADLIRIKLGEPPAAAAPLPTTDDCPLRHLTSDQAGVVWATTSCGVAWQYQPNIKRWSRHTLAAPANSNKEFAPIIAIAVSTDGTAYALGASGLGELTSPGEAITTTAVPTATTSPYPTYRHPVLFPIEGPLADQPGILGGSQSAADLQGGIWLAINGQPDLWHYVDGHITTYTHPLSGQTVNLLYVDQRGWLWEVGNDQQLAGYDGHAWHSVTMPDLGTVRRMANSPDGRLWFVGDYGVAAYDPTANTQP